MTLRRTASSLYSHPKFYGADLIVYCEGGAIRDPLDPEAFAASPSTNDESFWQSVISTLDLGRSFHVKSLGSKSTLLSVAADAERLGIRTITVCVDRDYSEMVGSGEWPARVVCTLGYSWENDVVRYPVLQRIASTFLGRPAEEGRLHEELRSDLSCLASTAKQWCELDIALVARRLPALFDRSAAPRHVDQTTGSLLQQDLELKKHQLTREENHVDSFYIEEADVLRIIFGKLAAWCCYCIVRFRLRSYNCMPNISYDTFIRMAITEMRRLMESGDLPELSNHFHSQKAAF